MQSWYVNKSINDRAEVMNVFVNLLRVRMPAYIASTVITNQFLHACIIIIFFFPLFVFLPFAICLYILSIYLNSGNLQQFGDFSSERWREKEGWSRVTERNKRGWIGETERRQGERMKDGRVISLPWPVCLEMFLGPDSLADVTLSHWLPCHCDTEGDGGGSKYRWSCLGAV